MYALTHDTFPHTTSLDEIHTSTFSVTDAVVVVAMGVLRAVCSTVTQKQRHMCSCMMCDFMLLLWTVTAVVGE
jgi:hypothetical protein